MGDLIQNIRDIKHDGISRSTVKLGFENVSFGYDDMEIIFENANFNFSNSGLILFKGSNGSGKTTIIKLLSSFKLPGSGTVVCDTNSVIGYSSANGSDINSYVKCDSFLSDCLGDLRDRYLLSVLDYLNLSQCKQHRILELSSGQRKKLSFFRTLTKSQYCMFFDEPLSFLDVSFQRIVIDQICKLKETMTILIATHTDKFDGMADCICEIENKSINIIKS